MKENQFGLVAKTRQYGNVRFKNRVNEHRQKSEAGKLFATDPDILSVYVFKSDGRGRLYLKKDPVTLECVMRQEWRD